MEKDIKLFLIIYFECFFILIFFGEVLPRILELVLNNYYNNPEFHKNSILVGREVNKGLQFIYNYMKTFKLFLF